MAFLELERIHKSFGAVHTIRGIDLTIEVGKGSGVSAQRVGPLRIGVVGREAEQVSCDAPERISRVSIVFAGGQRHDAGHVAEDQDTRVDVRDGRQPVQQRGS